IGRVLTDSGSKHERIYPTQHSSHATDGCSQSMHEDVERQRRSLVTSLNGSQDFAHVAGDAGDCKQPRFLIQYLISLLSIKPALTHQVDQNSRIHRARAGSHHQSVEWSKSHGGINAPATLNRGDGAAVSQVAGHEFEGARVLLQHLSGASGAV